MKKILLLFVTLSAITQLPSLLAQTRWWKDFEYPRKNSVSFSPGGGISGILINGGFNSPTVYSWTCGGDILFTRMLSKEWGLQLGIGGQCVNGAFHMENLGSDFVAPISVTDGSSYHNEDAKFQYLTKYANEKYSMPLLELPVRLSYTSGSWSFAGGLKLAFPLKMNADYEYSDGVIGITEIIGTGTVLEEMLPVGSFPARSGSYTVCGLGSNSFTELVFVAISLEGGYRISLGGHNTLMASLYVDYGLNQLHAGCEGNDDFVSIKDGVPTYNTCMASNEITGFNYLAAGLRLTYQLGYGEKFGAYPVKFKHHSKKTRHYRSIVSRRQMRKMTRRRRYKFFWEK